MNHPSLMKFSQESFFFDLSDTYPVEFSIDINNVNFPVGKLELEWNYSITDTGLDSVYLTSDLLDNNIFATISKRPDFVEGVSNYNIGQNRCCCCFTYYFDEYRDLSGSWRIQINNFDDANPATLLGDGTLFLKFFG